MKEFLRDRQVVAVVDIGHGDSGKGKVVDYLVGDFDINVRVSGGPNTGATSRRNGENIVLHLLPFGTLHDSITNILTGCVLIDPEVLVQDIELVNRYRSKPIEGDGLVIDHRLPLILPHHKVLDYIRNRKIGTTMRGVGPATADFFNRSNLEVCDLFDDHLDGLIEREMEASMVREMIERDKCDDPKFIQLTSVHNNLNPKEIANVYRRAAERLITFIGDGQETLMNNFSTKKRILIVGTQGAFLDPILGDRPYVASTPVSASGLLYASGLPKIDFYVCIIKALPTNAGAGPIPTKIEDQLDRGLRRKKGDKFGAVIGRSRDVYYHALPQLYHALKSIPLENAGLVIGKADTVAGECLKVYEDYKFRNGVSTISRNFCSRDTTALYPRDERVLSDLVGNKYCTFGPIENAVQYKSLEELRDTSLIKYVSYIADKLKVKLLAVGNGPERNDFIV